MKTAAGTMIRFVAAHVLGPSVWAQWPPRSVPLTGFPERERERARERERERERESTCEPARYLNTRDPYLEVQGSYNHTITVLISHTCGAYNYSYGQVVSKYPRPPNKDDDSCGISSTGFTLCEGHFGTSRL